MNNNLADKDLYGGSVFNWGIGGSGIWLSSDVITYIILNKDKLNYNTIDDVTIGKLLKKDFNKTNIPIFIMDRRKPHNNYKNKELCIKQIIQDNHYNIRLKQSHEDRTNDIKMVKYLWKFFYEDSK